MRWNVKLVLLKTTEKDGFTLIEVLVSMALFIGVMVIASETFTRIITMSSKYSKMEETSIAGVIGLEVMRHDLEHMGFGLPWGFVSYDGTITEGPKLSTSGLTYAESTDTFGKDLNDAPSGIPRPFVGYSPKGNFLSAYISVKGTSVASSKASQRWTYIPFMNYSAAPRESRPVAFASSNLDATSPYDKVLIINSSPEYPNLDRRLVVAPGNSNLAGSPPSPPTFLIDYKDGGNNTSNGIGTNYLPSSASSTYMVYGLLDKNSTTAPRMPFNRADFFISNRKVPSFCAPDTGVLYKAIVNHGTTGDYDYIPLLDCVADMQVVLGWDTSTTNPPAGSVNAYTSLTAVPAADGGTVNATNGAADAVKLWLSDPQAIREHLKIVKVYILAQEGKRDPSYTAPNKVVEVGNQNANGGLTPKNVYTLSDAQTQYRWKLYQIVVRPRNLVSNSN